MMIPAPGNSQKLDGVNTPQAVQKSMKALVLALQNDDFVIDVANEVKKDFTKQEQPAAVAQIVYSLAYFEPDAPTLQVLKTPRRLAEDRRANCVDYTIFIAAVCLYLGFPVTIRIVKLEGQKNFGHVYPVVNGQVLDVVPGQNQNGNEWATRKFNSRPILSFELPYLSKIDLSL